MSRLNRTRFGNREISFTIVRTNRRKTVGIYVDPQSGIIVRSPRFLRIAEIREVVKKKAKWIIEKQRLLKNLGHAGTAREFISEETFPYLGREYRLKVTKTDSKREETCKLINGKFVVNIDKHSAGNGAENAVRRVLENWFQERAAHKIGDRVRLYAQQTGRWPKRIEIKNHRSRWGSCSHDGVLRFNWKIIMAPLSLLDYVVVHELCHLIHLNHSPRFWKKVEAIIPDYISTRKKLREYSLQTEEVF